MIFIVRSFGRFENVSICYPIYMLHNFELLKYPWVILEVFEIILFIFTAFYLLKSAYIGIKIRVFHVNLTIVFVALMSQWCETFLGKVLSWPYETGYWTLRGLTNQSQVNQTLKQWYTDKKEEMIPISNYKLDYLFFISGFLKLHASLSMATVLLFISIERSFACYYLYDYEKKSRLWIAITIVLVGHVLNFIISFLFYFKLIPFSCMLLCVLAPNIVGFKIIFYTRYLNQKVTEAHEKFASLSNYTLAARFQAKENIKCFQMIQTVIIAGMGIAALGITTAILLFLNFFPQLDTLLSSIIRGEMSFTALIITMAIMYSVDSFRKSELLSFNFIWQKFKIGRKKVSVIAIRKDSVIKTELIRKETETYFNQLASSWI